LGLCLAPIRPVVCTRQDVDQDQANAKSTRVAHAFADIRLVVWSSARLAQMGARSADCDLPSWAERNGDREGRNVGLEGAWADDDYGIRQ
jgi:hypothetical protein